jgi:hypothetical protein
MEYLELDEDVSFQNNNSINGRVNAMSNVEDYKIKRYIIEASEHQTNIISRNLNCTGVSKVFFSMPNINLLQSGIRNKILNETMGDININRQSDDELKIIMRSIYFQHGKNLPENINEQVLDLNTRVIVWAVPQIITNIKQSRQYIKDISTMPMPLDRSILPSNKGMRTLEITKFH